MIKTIFFLFLSFSQLYSAIYSAKEAWNHVGEDAAVCGKVVSIYYSKRSKGQPTFLNLDKPYPNQLFTIVIWGDKRSVFKNIGDFKGKRLCFEGTIESYRERPEMEIESPSQVHGSKR